MFVICGGILLAVAILFVMRHVGWILLWLLILASVASVFGK